MPSSLLLPVMVSAERPASQAGFVLLEGRCPSDTPRAHSRAASPARSVRLARSRCPLASLFVRWHVQSAAASMPSRRWLLVALLVLVPLVSWAWIAVMARDMYGPM